MVQKDSATETGTSASGPVEKPRAAAEGQAVIKVDDSRVENGYANFFRVMGTAEEVILDFGLDPQPFQTGSRTVAVTQRVVVNHYTAKRLLAALSAAIQRHESTFGVLETDIAKRARAKS